MSEPIIQQFTCTKCGQQKTVGEFYPRKNRPDGKGHSSWCKDCTNTANATRNSSPEGKKRDSGYRKLQKYKTKRNERSRQKYKPGQDTERKRRYFESEKYNVEKRPVVNKARRIYRKTAKGQETSRRGSLRRKYGLSLEGFNQMLAEQKGLCAICLKPNLGGRALVVDHTHHSGTGNGKGPVRRLLCTLCNLILGRWEDSPETAQRAVDYLLKHRQLKLVV